MHTIHTRAMKTLECVEILTVCTIIVCFEKKSDPHVQKSRHSLAARKAIASNWLTSAPCWLPHNSIHLREGGV